MIFLPRALELSYRTTMTTRPPKWPRRSVLFSFKFLGTAIFGSLIMAFVSIFAQLPAQIAVLGASISVLIGLIVAYLEQDDERERRRADLLEKLQIPVALAPEHELFTQYSVFASALAELAKQSDSVVRDIALIKLSSIAEEMQSLAKGQVVFAGTETWRTVYEEILQTPGLRDYRSVAWVKTKDYWQDPPGKQSIRLNLDLVQQGLRISRIVILRDSLWPIGDLLPSLDIRPWIENQHDRGVNISLVRESELSQESDLVCDFAIYGERASGIQELDEQSRTTRFILNFDRQSLRLAQNRWERLSLYAVRFGDLLDQSPTTR
jgi:hypothetical protein